MIRTWKSFLRHKLSLYIWCLYKSISFCYLFIKLFIFYSHYCLLLNWTVLWVLWHRNVSFSGTNKGIQMLILIISTILKVISRFWLIKHVFTDSLCCQSFLLACHAEVKLWIQRESSSILTEPLLPSAGQLTLLQVSEWNRIFNEYSCLGMLMVMMTNNCKCVEKKNQHERQKQRKKNWINRLSRASWCDTVRHIHLSSSNK